MQFAKTILLCAAGAILASLLGACGSGNSTAAPATIRVVNATGTAVTFSLSGAYVITGTAASSSSSYESVPPGTYTSSVAGVSTGFTAGPSQTLGLATGQNYTTLAYARDGVVYAATITDNLAVPASGYTTLNIANVSSDAGALDVYLLSSGATPQLGQATFQSVQGLSTAATFASGTFDIVITGAGNPSDVRLRLAAVVFTTAQAYTLGLTSTSGGALVNSVLIPQSVSVPATNFHTTTQARVRVMSALAQTSQIALTVSGGAAGAKAFSDFAPFPTKYAVVDAGDTVTALSAAGVTVTPPAGKFIAGSDYTVLVYTGASGPVAVSLTDTNQSLTSSASIRVINGAASGTTAASTQGVTFSASNVEIATQILAGTASAYYGVSPSSTANLQLIGGGYNSTLVNQSLVTGAVYTLFLYDSTLDPLLIRDR